MLKAAIPSEYDAWAALGEDRAHYTAEKERIGRDFVALLDQRFPGLAAQVEMVDVATPLTYVRYTGNWRGAMEGFMPGIKTMLAPLPKTLPGVEHFSMAGQWVSPGGGLQSGLLTGRDAIRRICKAEGLPFV